MRLRLALILLLGSLAPATGASAEPLSHALAVTDPQTLRDLSSRADGLDLGRMLGAPVSSTPINNDALFALPSMAAVRSAMDDAFARAESQRAAADDVQLFDRSLLYSNATRFVLAGIVSRMDRAYVAPATCGEVRLIYRLTRIDGDRGRLPMTLNLVLRARNANETAITCAELATRWLAAADAPQTAAEMMSQNGVLASVVPAQIDRIEINLQLAYTPKSEKNDFKTEYLQQVFRFDATRMTFEQAPLENQIDRDRLLSDGPLGQAFKNWLLDPLRIAELDQGTILIPEQFLARQSLAATPVGFAPSQRQPAYGLTQSDKADMPAMFSDDDVVTALKNVSAQGVTLQNIRSPAGFARRLNDISCGGCHQVRGIGGFHFPGVDWLAEKPSNVTNVPASPHFIGDQPRRREIAATLRDGRPPDFSRGFSDRPQLRGNKDLMGTQYVDGWGAHCIQPSERAIDDDQSFSSWTCAKGLSCQSVGNDPAARIGMCFVGQR